MKRWLVVIAMTLWALVVAAQEVYVDPTGSYQFQVPTGWSAEERAGFVLVLAPNDEIVNALSVEDTEDLAAAIERLWAKFDPTFDTSRVLQTQDVPDNQLQGFEAGLSVLYADGTGPDGALVAAGAYRLAGRAYPSITVTTLSALQRRFSQYLIFSQSYRATDLVPRTVEAAAARSWDEAMAERLSAFIERALVDLEVPGAAVAVVQDGRVVFAQGYGTTGSAPVDADTVFLTASLTKSMTTLMMAQAVDDGVFDWNTRVIDVLPTFAVADPNITQTITMQNLVCACSGVPRRDFEIIFNTLDAEDMLESLATFEFFTPFGEAFQYSNQLVAAAGYLTALARGDRYGQLNEGFARLLDEYLFVPLSMSRTTLRAAEVTRMSNVAQPHSVDFNGLVPFDLAGELWVESIAPSGGVWSSANDMARYLRLMLAQGEFDGVRLVRAETLAHTWQPQVQVSATADYGLGWILSTYAGHRLIFHDGNALGYTALMGFLPEPNVGVIVLANKAYSPLPNLVLTRALELTFNRADEMTAALAANAEALRTNRRNSQAQYVPPNDLSAFAPFVGAWANPALGDLTIRLEGDHVIADFGQYVTRLWENVPQTATTAEETFYVSADAPLAGQVLLRFRAGNTPQIVFGAGAIEYTFTRP